MFAAYTQYMVHFENYFVKIQSLNFETKVRDVFCPQRFLQLMLLQVKLRKSDIIQ